MWQTQKIYSIINQMKREVFIFMGATLSIQVSAFSNKKIVPNAENIAVIMPKLKNLSGIEFLPNIINTQKIDIATGKIDNLPNLSFASINKTGQVVCTDNRIDCIFNFEIDKQDEVEARFNTASCIISFIMQNESVFANRLALNVNYLSDVCNGNSLFETQVMHVLPFYQGKDIKEWSSRTNAVGQMKINDLDENLNVITEYTHTTEPVSGETRILCHIDINTISENQDFRFKYDAISTFIDQAKQIYEDIQSDFDGLVNNGE